MIELLPAEEAEIAAVRAAVTEFEFNAWFDQSAIKARVKKACMERQRLRCCYYRKFKDTTNNNEWDLEHILCKLWYPQFFASPANLAIACKQCNIAKSETDVLHPQPRPDPRLTAVPAGSASYAIPPPWIDDWHAHLSHVNYQIYSGGTEKGLELLKLCKLNRTAVEEGGLNYDSVCEPLGASLHRFGQYVDGCGPARQKHVQTDPGRIRNASDLGGRRSAAIRSGRDLNFRISTTTAYRKAYGPRWVMPVARGTYAILRSCSRGTSAGRGRSRRGPPPAHNLGNDRTEGKQLLPAQA